MSIRHMFFVGGCLHGQYSPVNTERGALNVPKPIRFSFGDYVPEEPEIYRPRTFFVGPPEGCEGPQYPVRMMVADELREAHQVAQLTALDGFYPKQRTESMRLAVENHERESA